MTPLLNKCPKKRALFSGNWYGIPEVKAAFVLALVLFLAEGCALVAKLATHHPCGGASNLVQNLRCDGRKLKNSGQFKLGNGQFGILCLSLSKNG